ncbi:hypothetical protein [Companilactobacillus nantensis]|uniref:Uncharacterized protein n=1 Tax=Companilactobacillus nantensis DSM 16982 TaxID=1423774 RepID=A0A0R1WJM9_9LACO|nr:hypothetical protein [Companilactobacillus nantensis]KRM17967.1 hypothetical protein FD31_GL002135 [Companilactobacillus nantensis DSM 16982]GEO63630.1 hypothetical protein LNA01_08130 [Companilactobacillus nantensis]
MSTLKDIHDYVKKNYEAGNYDDAKAAYTSWETEAKRQSNLTDFEMGVQKAQRDYKKNGTFATYPELAIDVVNKLFDDKALEVSEFIRGYNSEKEHIKKH